MSSLLRGARALANTFSWKSLRQRFKGVDKRQLQQQLDTYQLFLYTSLHAERQARGGALPDGFAEQLMAQVPVPQHIKLEHIIMSARNA